MSIIHVGVRRELLVDDHLIGRLENTELRLHEPAPGGTAIELDRPWEGPGNFGYAVLQLDGRYLMYYRAMTTAADDVSGVLCVAISDDGATWHKPNLGLVDRAGRADTNIVAINGHEGFMATPWLDTRPGVPDAERIKAITSEPVSGETHHAFKDPKGPKRLVFRVSADGFRFHKLDPQPDLVSDLANCFDGGNTLFWSEAEQQYVLYYRFSRLVAGWHWRSVARTTSPDLMQWTPSQPMTAGDAPPEEFYINNTTAYFRAPHQYIAPAARFMQGKRVVTDGQVQAIDLQQSHGHFYGNDCSDAVLLTSRAGSTQYDRAFMGAFVRPGLGASNWVSRTNYPLTGIYPCGEEQMMLWVTRHFMQPTWHIERLVMRLDGFGSVNAPHAGGSMITKPLIFEGGRLAINYRTSAAGAVRVEMQDDAGQPLPGFTINDCEPIVGDEIERTVRWRNGADVNQWAGQPVRLRFTMNDADLFSFRFS